MHRYLENLVNMLCRGLSGVFCAILLLGFNIKKTVFITTCILTMFCSMHVSNADEYYNLKFNADSAASHIGEFCYENHDAVEVRSCNCGFVGGVWSEDPDVCEIRSNYPSPCFLGGDTSGQFYICVEGPETTAVNNVSHEPICAACGCEQGGSSTESIGNHKIKTTFYNYRGVSEKENVCDSTWFSATYSYGCDDGYVKVPGENNAENAEDYECRECENSSETSDWENFPELTGVEVQTTTTVNCIETTETYKYRCAAGYYSGTGTSETDNATSLNCVKCSPIDNLNTTSPAGSTSCTACCVQMSSTTYQNEMGSFRVVGNDCCQSCQ